MGIRYESAQVLPYFHHTSAGGVFKPIFLMDWSPIHAKKLDNALNAKRMNVQPCGHQPLMEDGFFLKDGIKVKDSLTTY